MALIVGGTTVTGTQVLDATKLSGNLPAINGSSLTNLSTTTTTGTWTPTMSAGSIGSANGQYQKIGKFVFCQFECQMTSQPPSNDTHWYMGGLPFTAMSYDEGYNNIWFPGFGHTNASTPLSSYTTYVKDNSTEFGYHFSQGHRQTQYYATHSYGGLRNQTAQSIYNGSNENWMFGKIFYVSAS